MTYYLSMLWRVWEIFGITSTPYSLANFMTSLSLLWLYGSVSTSKVNRVIFHFSKSFGRTSVGGPLTTNSLEVQEMTQNMLEKNIFVHIWPLAQTSTPSLVCLRIVFSPPYLELSFFRLESRSLRASIRNLHRLMPMWVLVEYQGSSRNRG